jgi:hypothetical protein
MAEDRVSTSITFDTPGTGVWIMVQLLDGRKSARIAERDMAGAVMDKVSECMRRSDNRLRADRHTWVTVTWYASDGDDHGGLPGVVAASRRSLAKAGIHAEHAHITPQVAPSTHPIQTSYPYPITVPGRLPRLGSRIEFDLIQPQIKRPVGRWHGRGMDSFPMIDPGNWRDQLQCPIDHIPTIPAAQIYAIWRRAWTGPAAGRYTLYPIHADLVASRRCPACLTQQLEEAPKIRTPNGQERTTGRCPCCQAQWLTDEPNGWACLAAGRLTVVFTSRTGWTTGSGRSAR